MKCQYFDKECCINETVVLEYRKEWNRPNYVLGIGPPLCRKYCPYLSNAERRKAYFLYEGKKADEGKSHDMKIMYGKDEENDKNHMILFTPLPKFWLSGDSECITFETDFNETIHYHMVLLGWCEWDIPEHLTVYIPVHETK